MKTSLITLTIISILGVSLMSCSSFGSRPNKEMKKTFKNSKQYNAKAGVFENRQQDLIREMKKRNITFSAIKDWLGGGKDRVPSNKLPEVKPDLKSFMSESDELKVIWFGHSSFLLNMNGKIILVDPVFGTSASPVSFMVKRFQKPVIELKDLPKVDYIVISHDHYDHLDMPSIKHFVGSDVQFVTPLGVGSHLQGWGIKKENIVEKDWWESAMLDGVEFIATPAQHFSGRNGIHDNETLWASWVIRNDNHNVYFSGDSGYDTHFKEIGDKYGPFDLAFIENGQYNKLWEEVHMLPEQSIQAFKDLKGKTYFPVHWGMFELAMHAWYEPIQRISDMASADGINLVTPKIGEVLNINDKNQTTQWWKENYIEASKTQIKQGVRI